VNKDNRFPSFFAICHIAELREARRGVKAYAAVRPRPQETRMGKALTFYANPVLRGRRAFVAGGA
jgi:hypothetical protein